MEGRASSVMLAVAQKAIIQSRLTTANLTVILLSTEIVVSFFPPIILATLLFYLCYRSTAACKGVIAMPHISLKSPFPISRAVIGAFLLCGILAGCAPTVANTPSAPSTAKARATAVTTPDAATGLTVNANGVATVNNVQMNVTIDCGLWVVLKPHAPTYTSTELAAIARFVGSIAFVPGAGESSIPYEPDQMPSTLQYVPGSEGGCGGTYEITNTGKDLVQINQVGFQGVRPPSRLAFAYHVIDACPYMRICVCGGCGAVYPCSYFSNVTMSFGQPLALAKVEVQPSPEGSLPDPDCPAVINLRGGQTVTIAMSFSLDKSFLGYWLRGVPALNMTSSAGTTTITYPTLRNNLLSVPFGNEGFPGTCYTQKGNTFKPVTSFKTAPDPTKDPSEAPYNVYVPICM